MASCLSMSRCLSRKHGKDHPAPKPWSWQKRLILFTWVAAVAGLVTGVSLYIYSHLQDTGVSLGKQRIMLNRSVAVKASIFASDAEHDAALVRVANMQNLCSEEKRGWKLNCRVLMAYENFAGRISKEDYEQAFQESKMTHKLVDKPGWMFKKYTAEMAWDPDMVTATNYQQIKFHHQNYGELRLWPISSWAVCARVERSLAEVEANPAAYLETIQEELYQYATFIEWSIKQIEEFRPDVVIVAQGHYHFAAGFRIAAILKGLQVVALETPINNRRLVWSTMSGISVDRGVERNMFWRYNELVKPDVAKAEVQRYLDRAKSSKMLVHASPDNTNELDAWLSNKPRGQKILAYLAQVYTDTAVILNIGKGFISQAHVLWTVAKWCVDNNQPVVIKFHPRETPPKDLLPIYGPRLNHLTLRRLREQYDWDALIANNKDIILMDNTNSLDTYAIIEAANAVVTINSGSGLEALIKGKEAILAGNGYYGGLGFTHHAPGPQAMERTLETVLDSKNPLKLNVGSDVANFFFIFNRWATIPKTAKAVVGRACGFPARWPLPKSQTCEEDGGDEDLGTLI